MPILWLKCNNTIKKTNIGGVEMEKLERKLSSSQMIILGFAAVILLGALLLMLPVSSKSGEITPFLDCLLTSTSAVCDRTCGL